MVQSWFATADILACVWLCTSDAIVSDQPRRSGSFGTSSRDSSSILSPTMSGSSMGSSSGWGGSGMGSATGTSGDTSQFPSSPTTRDPPLMSPKVRFGRLAACWRAMLCRSQSPMPLCWRATRRRRLKPLRSKMVTRLSGGTCRSWCQSSSANIIEKRRSQEKMISNTYAAKSRTRYDALLCFV